MVREIYVNLNLYESIERVPEFHSGAVEYESPSRKFITFCAPEFFENGDGEYLIMIKMLKFLVYYLLVVLIFAELLDLKFFFCHLFVFVFYRRNYFTSSVFYIYIFGHFYASAVRVLDSFKNSHHSDCDETGRHLCS